MAILTQDRLKQVLRYNPDSGVFTRLLSVAQAKAGSQAGSQTSGYLAVRIDGTLHYCHRLAWFYMTGQMPAGQIDHINGVGTDNRWCNLRDVSRRTNQQNRQKHQANNSCGLLGVSRNKGRFMSRIVLESGDRYLGTFDTPQQAHEAYLTAKRQLHAGCTI